jgi:N-acetylneuraminate synthase
MGKEIKVAGRLIGDGHPCFIIAEAGVNHNGDIDLARKLIDIAANCGADAVKFQTFCADRLVTPSAPVAKYQARNIGEQQTQLDMLRKLELSEEAHRILFDYARERGLIFLSTPFDELSADLLEELGVSAYKVPSGELSNLRFLRYLARKGKPLIISTGMATLADVELAIEALESSGCKEYVLLHCVSNYPAEAEEVNLRAMLTLRAAFGVPVGYSDHTLGIAVPLAAVALGACVIEKHFTIDRSLPGPDHKASATPEELRELISSIRTIERALGDGRKRPAQGERDTMLAARKSLIASCDIAPGTKIEEHHITLRRPGTGLPPTFLPYLVGRIARTYIRAGTPITLDMVA